MRVLTFAVLALSLVFGVLQVFFVGLTNDTEIFMQQALSMWRGEGMYTTIIQINAPFNIMVYAPLAAFAAHFGLPPAMVLHGFAFIVSVIGILSLNHALKFHDVSAEDRAKWCAGAAFLLLASTPKFGVFADREHLLFAFALPWILQMLLRFKPLPYTAVLAAIGFCMRPHNVILFGVLTLIGGPRQSSLTQRLFSASSWIIGSIMGAYVLSMLVFFPDYITKMVPMGSLIYSASQVPMSRKLTLGLPFMLMSLAGLFAFIQSDRLAWYGFTFTIMVIFLINSGWDYTYYWLIPPVVLIYTALLCSPFRESLTDKPAARMMSVSLLLTLLALSGFYLVKDVRATAATGYSSHFHELPAGLKADLKTAAGSEFILLSPMLWNTDLEPFNGSPKSVFGFDVLWPLFWLYQHEGDNHFEQVLHFTTDPLLLALKNHPNAPVIVDTSPELPVSGSTGVVFEYLGKDLRVREAFGAYAVVKNIDYCTPDNTAYCRFEVWRRSVKR